MRRSLLLTGVSERADNGPAAHARSAWVGGHVIDPVVDVFLIRVATILSDPHTLQSMIGEHDPRLSLGGQSPYRATNDAEASKRDPSVTETLRRFSRSGHGRPVAGTAGRQGHPCYQDETPRSEPSLHARSVDHRLRLYLH